MSEVNASDILISGFDNVRMYHRVLTNASEKNVQFTSDDFMSYLSEIDGLGSTKETTEVKLYCLKQTLKVTTGQTCKDLTCTEAFTADRWESVKEEFAKDNFVVIGMFDSAGKHMYSAYGQLSDVEISVPDQGMATIKYTMAVSDNTLVTKAPAPAETV